jgi:hypothetical protein
VRGGRGVLVRGRRGMMECVWSSGRSVCYYESRLHRGFTKLGTSGSIHKFRVPLPTAQEPPPPLPCSRYRCTFLHPAQQASALCLVHRGCRSETHPSQTRTASSLPEHGRGAPDGLCTHQRPLGSLRGCSLCSRCRCLRSRSRPDVDEDADGAGLGGRRPRRGQGRGG